MSFTKGTPASSQIIWLEQKVSELQAEVERLKSTHIACVDEIAAQANIMRALERERDQLKSCQESVLAEVGEFEGNKILTIDQDDIDCTYHSSPYVEHLERRAEHLAAKLVEAQKDLEHKDAYYAQFELVPKAVRNEC